MKKLFMICFMGLALTASAGIFPDNNFGGEGGSTGDVSNDTHVDINQNIDVVVNTPTVQGEQGIPGESIVGPQGIAGVVDYDGVFYSIINQRDNFNDLAKEISASMGAMSSVELNPDHDGWSASLGFSNVSGTNSGAMGIMYGFKASETVSVGINVKGYHSMQSGHKGASAGITVGW